MISASIYTQSFKFAGEQRVILIFHLQKQNKRKLKKKKQEEMK